MFSSKMTNVNAKENVKKAKGKASKKREKRKNIKVLFGIKSLNLGGSSRVLVDLIKEVSKIYNVTIFTIYAGGDLEHELKSHNVKIKSIYNTSLNTVTDKRYNFNKKVLKLFSAHIYKLLIKDKYDVEIAFDDSEILDIFATKSKAYKISWIHNYLSKENLTEFKNLNLESVLDDELSDKRFAYGFKKYSKYRKYDKLVFVSNSALSRFTDTHPKNTQEKQVIYNYLDINRIKKCVNRGFAPEIVSGIPSFVVVGDITRRKGLFRLLDVHKKLIDEGFIHNIYIIGEGENYSRLNKKRLELGLKKSFVLLGKKANPYPYIKEADFFALPSYYEGYSVVLDEAKVLNKKIITTKLAGKEAALGYDKAIIAKNTEEGIYLSFKKLLSNSNKRKDKKKGNKKGKNNNRNSNRYMNNEFSVLNSNKVYKIIELIDSAGGE